MQINPVKSININSKTPKNANNNNVYKSIQKI